VNTGPALAKDALKTNKLSWLKKVKTNK